MVNKFIFPFIILSLIIWVLACEVIEDPNMAMESVTLLSPPDNFNTTLSTHTLWWEELEDATGYNLQIVSPSFATIERLFLDSNITSNKYDFTFLPGEYAWRVRAYNSSSTTAFSEHSLSIDSTSDISQQTLQLSLPIDKDTTNVTQLLFKWFPLYNADDYNYQLYYEDNKIFTFTTKYDTISKSLNNGDGNYRWEVRGQNASSNTAYSYRTIFIDTTPPNKPSLIIPDINAILPDTIVNFEWDRGIVAGSSISDSLYIATDISMNNLILNLYLTETQYEDSLGPGEYYWRVRSIDKAGNKSNYSFIRKFVIL
ncbi:MAG: hypothetical protein R2764_23125 [Bacteroidales bacterium]